MQRWVLSLLKRTALPEQGLQNSIGSRALTTTPPKCAKKMPDRPKPPPEKEFTEAFLHGSGPGGQKINKTSSAVQLKHSASGIVLKVQATRSRTQNRKLARQMLADRLEDIEKGDQSRSAIKMAVKQKRKSSATKKTRRKYRKLEEEKLAGHEGAGKEE